MMKYILFSVTLLSVFFAGLATAQNDDAFAVKVACLTNEFRRSHGLPALKLSKELNASSKRHSNTQASKKSMHHAKLTGITNAENVAWLGGKPPSPIDAAIRMVKMWINSPGHRKNMLGSYKTIGAGYTSGYGTQQFSRTDGGVVPNCGGSGTSTPSMPTPTPPKRTGGRRTARRNRGRSGRPSSRRPRRARGMSKRSRSRRH
jgi:hypothetical protein